MRSTPPREVQPLPLWCISPAPNAAVRAALADVPPNGRVSFFQGVDNAVLQAAYSRARAFLYPSLAEGFGWPLIEAQACGCPVITTDEPPMNEVAGDAAVYLPRLEWDGDLDSWASQGAAALQSLLAESAEERQGRAMRAQAWASRFDADRAADGYLEIYGKVLGQSSRSAAPGLAPHQGR